MRSVLGELNALTEYEIKWIAKSAQQKRQASPLKSEKQLSIGIRLIKSLSKLTHLTIIVVIGLDEPDLLALVGIKQDLEELSVDRNR